MEMLIYFIFNLNNIDDELNFIDEQWLTNLVYLQLALALSRIIIIIITYGFLMLTINKANEPPKLYSSTWTFLNDWTIIQLYFYTNYLYKFIMPIFLLTSIISFSYYKFIRTKINQI